MCNNTGGLGSACAMIIPLFHYSVIPHFPVSPIDIATPESSFSSFCTAFTNKKKQKKQWSALHVISKYNLSVSLSLLH